MLRASGSRAVNFDDAPGAVDQDLSLRDGVEIYFVANGGTVTAANKSQAKDPGSQATCLPPQEVVNLALDPGDIVMATGRHGVMTQQIEAPVSGLVNKPLRIFGDRAYAPVITVSGTERCLVATGKDYVHFGFFPDCSNTDGTYAAPVRVFGPSVGCRWEDITVTRNRNAGGTAAKDCFSVNANLGSPAHVVARNLGFKGTQGGSSSVQAVVCKNGSTLDVYGWSATDNNLLMTANGGGNTDTRLRVFDGFSDDNTEAAGNAVEGGTLEIHRSHLVCRGLGPTASATGTVRLFNCAVDIKTSQTTALAGVLEFHGCRLSTTGGGRYQIQDADAIWRFHNGVFLPGDGNFWHVNQSDGGAIQVQDSLIDCSSIAAADTGVFDMDADPATAGHYFRRLAVLDFGIAGTFIRVQGAAGGPAVPIEDVAVYNTVKAGTFLNNDRPDAAVSVTRCAFQNVNNPIDGAPTVVDQCGYDNSGATDGTNAVSGTADFLDPAGGDFRYGGSSDFAGAGVGGADIGPNRAYGY